METHHSSNEVRTEEPSSAEATRSPTTLLVLIGAGLLVGVVMGLFTLFNPQRTLGGARRSLPTPIPDRAAAGQSAPEFSGQTPDGETIALSDLRGHPVALNFWATWCAPCEFEMPALQAASQRYADEGLVILAVNAGESADSVRTYMEERDLTFPAVLDPDGEIVSLYGVRVFPTTIWIDAEGVIRQAHFGALDEDLIDRYVNELLLPTETASRPVR